MEIIIQKVRADSNITLENLAKSSGISKSTIQRIETGAVSPTMNQMERLAGAMGVRITDLFESEYK